jgi:dihydrofolate synthase/folylpolyglutamate synthase
MASELLQAGYPAIQDYLFGLKAAGPRFGIDRMRVLSERLGHPERAMPVVHVAGTNGKGSVSAMLESILRASGCTAGLYTSPHLVRLGERVQVNRTLLSEGEIEQYVGILRPISEGIGDELGPDERPTFFEFMTAMAFLQFARRGCDCSVIEAGLGGRLDATNVVIPEVCAITSIGMDHCDMLGNTLEAIAVEKAGIIKPGCPVVIGRMPAEAERAIRGIASSRNAQVFSVRQEYGDDVSRYPESGLEGDYQRWNAATATLVAGMLPSRLGISSRSISEGLSRVSWPGRWQRRRIGGRLAILDASHNPEGATVLDSNLRRLREETRRPVVAIVGALGAQRAGPLLEVLGRHCREIHLVVPRQSRASSHGEMEGLLPRSFRGLAFRGRVEDLFPGPDACTAGARDDTIVVTGSIYLLGEVMARLEPERGPGEGRLQDF